VSHCYVFVCILPGKAVFEMTYIVSGGTFNPTHSLITMTTYTHHFNGHFFDVNLFSLFLT